MSTLDRASGSSRARSSGLSGILPDKAAPTLQDNSLSRRSPVPDRRSPNCAGQALRHPVLCAWTPGVGVQEGIEMMEAGTTSRNASRLFAGLVIMAFGTLALLDNLGIVRIGNIWRLWPLILIAVGLAKVLKPRGSPGRFAGVLFSAAGLWLLMENLGVW